MFNRQPSSVEAVPTLSHNNKIYYALNPHSYRFTSTFKAFTAFREEKDEDEEPTKCNEMKWISKLFFCRQQQLVPMFCSVQIQNLNWTHSHVVYIYTSHIIIMKPTRTTQKVLALLCFLFYILCQCNALPCCWRVALLWEFT